MAAGDGRRQAWLDFTPSGRQRRPQPRARSAGAGGSIRGRIAHRSNPASRSPGRLSSSPATAIFCRVVLSARARAIAIPVTTSGASTGLLSPGDRVDVILTQSFKNDPPLTRRSVSETVVENLRVLAIDSPDTKPSGAGNSFGRTVTLEVTPEQAERINVATELGKLSLTLRNANTIEASGAGPTGEPVKPIWAGDVSPALTDAGSSKKTIIVDQPVVDVIRGTKTAAVKVR